MRHSIIDYKGKRVTLDFEEDLSNPGHVCIHGVEIDGKDCTPVLDIGNLTEVFESLIISQKEEV